MKEGNEKVKHSIFERFSSWVSRAAGSTPAFIGAVMLVVLWLFSGPLFHYSEVWQLFINTGTTIITFLMVFVIQKAQNKDSLALQLKLNELVASHELASNRMVSVEDLTEEELRVLQKYYQKLSLMSKDAMTLQESHSVEEAEFLHEAKSAKRIAKTKTTTKTNTSTNTNTTTNQHQSKE